MPLAIILYVRRQPELDAQRVVTFDTSFSVNYFFFLLGTSTAYVLSEQISGGYAITDIIQNRFSYLSC
jgi:ABC-type sulfate transport system permease component